MLFEKELKGMAIETPMGDPLGTVAGLILDLDLWKVKQLVVSPGKLKKNVTYNLTDITNYDEPNKKIVIKHAIEAGEEPEFQAYSAISLSELAKKAVTSSDDEKLKGIYDVEVATGLKEWEIGKLLIQTPWKERRLRISPNDVKEVGEHIVLKLSMEDITTREETNKDVE